MSTPIYVDAESARNDANAIGREVDSLQEAANRIQTIVTSDLPEHWRGQSATACQNKYAEEYQEFLTKTVPDMVEELKKYIDTCIKGIEEADEQLRG